MHCPICRSEFREGFTHCPDCDENLVDDLPPEKAPEYENLVPVFKGDSYNASLARAKVESAGIESWIQDGEVHGLFPALSATEVLVREKDETPALKALEIPKQ